MASVELDIPETLLESVRQAVQDAGITLSEFVRQAHEHETTFMQQEQRLINDATLAYIATCRDSMRIPS